MDAQAKRGKGRPQGKLKHGRTISCYIRSDIYSALVRHCELTGQTKTIAIERAIEQMTKDNGTFDGTDLLIGEEEAGAEPAEGGGEDG